MSKKPAEIKAVFDEKWPTSGLDPEHAVAFRGKIARELLALEAPEYLIELQHEIQAMGLDDENEGDGAPSPDEPSKEELRARYADISIYRSPFLTGFLVLRITSQRLSSLSSSCSANTPAII